MTWAQRTKAGVDAKHFQSALAEKPLFTVGDVIAMLGALAAIGVSGDDLSAYLARHQSGDWGDIDAHDRRENKLALEQGFRLMSVYTLSITGVNIWVITEADRSSIRRRQLLVRPANPRQMAAVGWNS